MKRGGLQPGDVVTLEHVAMGNLTDTRPARVRRNAGDYVYLDVYPIGHVVGRPAASVQAFHVRTGNPRRNHGWRLSAKHCDPRAGRGTTK